MNAFLISTRQNNVQIFSIQTIIQDELQSDELLFSKHNTNSNMNHHSVRAKDVNHEPSFRKRVTVENHESSIRKSNSNQPSLSRNHEPSIRKNKRNERTINSKRITETNQPSFSK